jgi:hypothetical protein
MMRKDDAGEPPPAIVDPQGRPARDRERPADCPRCGAPPKKRRLSGGFGELHDLCGVCGYDFPERTLW